MSLEAENHSAEEFTEDALARRVYHLNTLYELNQEISTLKDVHAVLNASLLYLTGVFGLRRGLIAIYKGDEPQPHKFVSRGMDENAEIRWCQQLESYLPLHVMEEVCITENDSDSPLAALLKGYELCIWLPLKVDEQTWGGIALGEKLSGMEFIADDMELLSTIAMTLQNVLNNVLLIEALNESINKEKRIRTVFQRYAPETVINEVLNPSNEELLLGKSEAVRRMFDEIISRLEEQHVLERDLEDAYNVQKYLLPDRPPQISGIEIAPRSIPARYVCGDFYDFISLSPHEVGVSLADISGKGMPAAMIATMLQTATRTCVRSYYSIPSILAVLNRFMFQHTEDHRYATMFYGHVDTKERTFTYSNAGHPPPILCRNGEVQLLEVGGTFIGMFEQCSYSQATISLQSRDVLVIYSDGVTDAGTSADTDEPDDAFGQERLETIIATHSTLSADALLDRIIAEVTGYANRQKQFDDITLIVMKVE